MGTRVEQWIVQWELQRQELLSRLARCLEERTLGDAEAGQSTVEYAAITALIVVVAITAMNVFGGGVGAVFTRMVARIQGIG